MRPDYVAKKSAFPVLSFKLIILFFLIVPLIIQIARIICIKCYKIEFYSNRIVVKWGVFNRYERQYSFPGAYSVKLSQTFWQRIFGYGNMHVDCIGDFELDAIGIKHPGALKRYLARRITSDGVVNIIHK